MLMDFTEWLIDPLMLFFFSFLFFLAHDFHFHINFCGSLMLTKYHLFYPLIVHLINPLHTFIIIFLYPISRFLVESENETDAECAASSWFYMKMFSSSSTTLQYDAFFSLSLLQQLPTTCSLLREREIFFLSIFGVADHWSGDDDDLPKRKWSRVTSEWIYVLFVAPMI